MAVYNLDPRGATRLSTYVEAIGGILRHKKKRESFAIYMHGLLGDGDRKSIEPIAARACPDRARTRAMHDRLLHFIANPRWDDGPIRRFAASYALEAMQEHGEVESWIIDDTGFLKKGERSPGVQRQYTGSAGKITNCQIGVSLTLATEHAHVLSDFQLYLPKSWTEDRKRCRMAHISDEVGYEPKWKLALEMIEEGLEAGHPPGVVLADADYGNKSGFRDRLTELGLEYAVGIQDTTVLRRVRGQVRRRLGPPTSAMETAFELEASDYRRVTWTEGTKGKLSSKFAAVRVVVGRGDVSDQREEWLLIEWPDAAAKPTKYALSTMSKTSSRKQLVRRFKARWRTERAYQDCKGQLGLDHFEGRTFTGWHHHVTAVLCCYAFGVAEQARSFSPSASGERAAGPVARAA